MKYIICADGKKYSRDSDNPYVAHCIKEEANSLATNTPLYSEQIAMGFAISSILILSFLLIFQFFYKEPVGA